MLVISAEQNFETQQPNINKKKKQFSGFFKEHIRAYQDHEGICRQWRKAGRPVSNLHTAKAEKLKSQRNLQKISRTEESTKAIKNHEELMETHSNDMSRVCTKLKQIRGDKSKSNNISIIETLCGTFEGQNVLEGFCANSEKLCNEDDKNTKLNSEFQQMYVEDNMIIFGLRS